jgi:hypothetical protein
MNKEILEKQLSDLRLKWKVFPKSYLEPNWWKYRADRTFALQLIEQIKKIESGIEITAGDMTEDQLKEIFT